MKSKLSHWFINLFNSLRCLTRRRPNAMVNNDSRRSMKMAKYVDILNEKGERQARCILKNGKVQCSGEDAELVADLEAGVTVTLANGKRFTYYPEDGIAFLEALGSVFDSPYEYATEIKEEEAVSS